MEELRDLQKIYSLASGRFNQYEGEDFVLPEDFKQQVKEINSSTIEYNKYSAIISTKGTQNGVLNIFLPNQWFYIASYFTDFYNELQKYKKEALKVVSKERLKELNGHSLTQEEQRKVNDLSLDDNSKRFLVKFMTDYSWWFGAKTIDRGDFYVSPILSSARLVNASQSFVADLCAFLADKTELIKSIISAGDELYEGFQRDTKNENDYLQQIFYGAPGTGKSHTIQERTEHEDVIRTTFHPDTDYSTFVGAYKPTTIDAPVMTVIGTKAVPVENEDGSPRIEPKIIYEFVNQAFLQAYVKAWEKYCEGGFDNAQKQFLVIEEINRGNCAQIFGDLFQLLDRNNAGFSDYPIKADADMAKQLKKQLEGLAIEDPDAINSLYKGEDVVSKVLNGELLLLPKNLYIWATMNTSDQSLFPIDSAFKRRWDWQYMPIANGFENWYISVDDYKFDWWLFLQKINKLIGATTHSEDKKLGYYFCKAKNKEIDANLFVSKVIFYLWNDVFKDYEFANSVFDDIDGKKLTFDKFYTTINGNTIVVEDKVVMFLNKLDEAIDKEYSMLLPNAEATTDQSGNDFTNYSFEGSAPMGKSALGKAIMLKYLNENAGLTFDEIKAKFPDSLLGSVANKGLIVKDEEDLGSYQRYYVGGFKSADGVKFKIYKQWTVGNIQNIKNFAFSQGWSVEEKGSWRRKDNNA